MKSADLDSLKRELEEEGLTAVNLAGTTLSPVGYGETIQLIIEGNYTADLNVRIPFLYKNRQDWVIPIKMKWYSTAKH